LGSPVFDKMEISLHPDYYTGKKFTIKANKKGMDQWAVKGARLGNNALMGYTLRHSQLVKGGELELDMGE